MPGTLFVEPTRSSHSPAAVPTVNDLLSYGAERKRQAEEDERKQDEEHAKLMARAYRARDFETREVIHPALQDYLIPHEVSLRYLPDFDKYERIAVIPEFAPIHIWLVKENNKWHTTNRLIALKSDHQAYEVEVAYLWRPDEAEDGQGEVGFAASKTHGHYGPCLELALVAAKDEYYLFQNFTLELEQLRQRQAIQQKELKYEPVDPPVPTDQEALEALNLLIDKRIEIKLKHAVKLA